MYNLKGVYILMKTRKNQPFDWEKEDAELSIHGVATKSEPESAAKAKTKAAAANDNDLEDDGLEDDDHSWLVPFVTAWFAIGTVAILVTILGICAVVANLPHTYFVSYLYSFENGVTSGSGRMTSTMNGRVTTENVSAFLSGTEREIIAMNPELKELQERGNLTIIINYFEEVPRPNFAERLFP